MNPRIGRPKVDNPKNIEVKVRFDEKTNTRVLEYCKEMKITRTEAIRRGIKLLLESNINA